MVPSSVDDARISESAAVKCLPARSRGPEEIGVKGVWEADDAGAGSPPRASASPSAGSDGSEAALEQVITGLRGTSKGVSGVTAIGCL
jgi:hypothetical protein